MPTIGRKLVCYVSGCRRELRSSVILLQPGQFSCSQGGEDCAGKWFCANCVNHGVHYSKCSSKIGRSLDEIRLENERVKKSRRKGLPDPIPGSGELVAPTNVVLDMLTPEKLYSVSCLTQEVVIE
jgi:hypothetical protein